MAQSLDRIDKIGSQSEAQQIIEVVRRKFIKNGPLLQACIDVVEEGIVHGEHLVVGKVWQNGRVGNRSS